MSAKDETPNFWKIAAKNDLISPIWTELLFLSTEFVRIGMFIGFFVQESKEKTNETT